MTPDPYTTSAGPYVLGALAPEERHAFELHLRECADCRAEVHDLAGLPGLLSRAPLRDVVADEPPGPPDTLLPGLLDRVRRGRRKRRTVLAGGAFALAACLIAVVALILGTPGTPGAARTPAPRAYAMSKVIPGPITATARVASAPGGSTVDLDCVYRRATGQGTYPTEPAYTLAVLDRYGATHRVATWRVADGETSLSSALDVTSDDITMIQIRDATDRPLLRLSWPPPGATASPS